MSKNLIDDLREFLKTANLSNYEINAFIVLLQSSNIKNLTAREISSKSNVPSGRIYEILDELKNKGMIEIIESRPKKFQAFSLNKALKNLITYQTRENKRKASFLYQQAKTIESKLYDSKSNIKKEYSRIFWSTAFGSQSIIPLYLNCFKELQNEYLSIGFINKTTLKILPFSKRFFETIKNTVEQRGINIKILWSFEYDERPISEERKMRNLNLYNNLKKKLFELCNLSSKIYGFEMRFVHKIIPTYYDLFDKNRIIFKLRNPINPWKVFACMNVLDPTLAEELRGNFYQIWTFEAKDSNAQ